MMNHEHWGPGSPEEIKQARRFEQGYLGEDPSDAGQQYALFFGAHPHSRRDDNTYAEMKEGGAVYGFNGHRVQIRVELQTHNYLKESELSGDEIRKGGEVKLFFNGFCVWKAFCRDPQRALLEVRGKIEQLSEHPLPLHDANRVSEWIGRTVYYHLTPAQIEHIYDGEVVLRCLSPDGFPPKPWMEHEDWLEYRDRARVSLDSPHIWWHEGTEDFKKFHRDAPADEAER